MLRGFSAPSPGNALWTSATELPSAEWGLLGATPPRNQLAAGLMLPPPIEPNPPKPYYLESWAATDYGQELRRPFWTADLSAPILVGINPVFGEPKILERHEFDDNVAYEAMRLRRLIADAELIGDLGARARPHEVINWAIRQYIPVPKGLLDLAVARGLPIKGHPSPLELAKTEQRSLISRAKEELAKRNAKIANLEGEIAKKCAEVEALLQRLATRASECSDPEPTSKWLPDVSSG